MFPFQGLGDFRLHPVEFLDLQREQILGEGVFVFPPGFDSAADGLFGFVGVFHTQPHGDDLGWYSQGAHAQRLQIAFLFGGAFDFAFTHGHP